MVQQGAFEFSPIARRETERNEEFCGIRAQMGPKMEAL
jgi:hypothetical protein